jgi:integrase
MVSLLNVSATSNGRNSKGIVKVENDDGRLRLRFSYAGKRHTLALKLPHSSVNQVFAQQKAAQIELDIISGNFDPTLAKYKPQSAKPKPSTPGSVCALFEQFTQEQIKVKGLHKGSLCRYAATRKHLERYFKEKIMDAIDDASARGFVDYLKKKVAMRTAKDYLILVQALWKWAMEKHGLKQNPWAGLVAGVKPPRKQKVKPFAIAEVQAIQAAFRADLHYCHYADFVTFLFGTGCRFGEAVALQWKHIADDFSTVWIGESVSRGVRKTTKTGKDYSGPKKLDSPLSSKLPQL